MPKHDTDINKKDLLNALAIHKKLAVKMTPAERERDTTLLTKRLNVAETFDLVELLTMPYNKEMQKMSERVSVLNMVVDKLALKHGIDDDELSKVYKESQKELKEANEKQIKQLKKQFKDLDKKAKNLKDFEEKKGK